DDDRVVRSAVERDLRRKYGKEYRILGAESGAVALEVLKELKLRGNQVALILADQRMPQMTGVEFLACAVPLFPDAKRLLLTAYADTEVAIRAINEIRLDHYLMKPWDPPEERLYPVISDHLEAWEAQFHSGFEGLRVIGHRWSPQAHAIKEFLARNQIPYRWLDIETDALAGQLLDTAAADRAALPVVIFPDGTILVQPSISELAPKAGLSVRAQAPFYDLVIAGSGPGGLGAGVYGASEGLQTLIIEREAPGGQAGQSSRIENYLGFPSGVSGGELARRAVAQARRFGAEILAPQEVTGLKLLDPYKILALSDGAEVSCHALLIATGVSYRQLDLPGCEELVGAGVYYGAAATEALSTSGQDVFVVGGGNSAGQAAMYLAGFARQVTMLVRGRGLAESMSRYLIDQIGKTPNISVRTRARVAAVHGNANLEAVTIEDVDTGATGTERAAALFIFIGAAPRTGWLAGQVEMDQHGFILTGPDLMRNGKRPRGWTLDRDPYWLESSVPGIFVAGDVRSQSVKRVASAVGEGAMAVQFVHRYLATL
ncbi:MAG: FAD-dependent oxidoreductase, partial [Nitrososphaerales archaeon]